VLGLLRVPRLNVNKAIGIKQFCLVIYKKKGGLTLKRRIINGLKDGLFVFMCAILIALILNFMNFNFGDNKIWTSLGNLGLINIFGDKQLNGLVILGFILGIVAFTSGFFSLDNDKKIKGE
ncbi:hypothetical protein, partial [Staphylococcus cohnii]